MKRFIYTVGTVSGRLFIIFGPISLIGMLCLKYFQSVNIDSGSQPIISHALQITLGLAVIGAIISAFCGLIIKVSTTSRRDVVPTNEPDT